MIFFQPGEKLSFFPQKVLLIFLCEPKTIFYLLFSYFLPFPPLSLPFLFPYFSFFSFFVIIFPPQPLKSSYIYLFAPPPGARVNRKIYTPA